MSFADLLGSTRTNTPPWPLAAMAMFPLTRKASPPNIFFSVSRGSLSSNSRSRSANSASYATSGIVQGRPACHSC
jgi:hypothetical protein